MGRSSARGYTTTSKPFSNFYKFLLEHPEWTAFIIVFGIMLWFNLHRSHFEFYYDTAEYWNSLAKAFDDPVTGRFSLLNYNSPLRGYLLPLILNVIIKLSAFLGMRGLILLEITQAFVFSFLIAVLIPYVLKKLFKSKPNLWQILMFGLLVIFFWRGYFFYPLSDFWALSFFVFGIYLFLGCESNRWALFWAGAFFGGAAVIRPTYLTTLIFLLLWSAYYFSRHQNHVKRQIFANELVLIIGLAFVFLPQILINKVHYGILSPLPQTQFSDEEYYDGNNLYLVQLSFGIQVQRYETFVGLESDYKSAAVFYMDQHGRNILVQAGYDPSSYFYPNPKILSWSEYILLTIRHPLDFLIIYVRHIFNGLDVVYTTPYIYNLHSNTSYIRLLNYSLLFLTVLYIGRRVKNFSVLSCQFLLLLIFVLPSILSIPTAIETRFLLSFHFISYSTTAFFVLPMLFSLTRKEKIRIFFKYLPWYSIFVVICFLLSMNTFAAMKSGYYVFW
ncbi:MAG: hypothetical protein HY863_16690 [Chloroflexi bacterium]|nr:hypothetical protein [Chloroflexota bacterium]